jgi:hypothetical protein
MLEETVSVIKEIEEEMLTLIQTDESLNRNYSFLTGITGIGFVNTVNTAIYTRNFEAFDHARQYACFVCVTHFPHQSGSSVKGRTKVSRFGNRHLKADLTQGTRSAAPRIKAVFSKKNQRMKKSRNGNKCREIQTHTENVCHSKKRKSDLSCHLRSILIFYAFGNKDKISCVYPITVSQISSYPKLSHL